MIKAWSAIFLILETVWKHTSMTCLDHNFLLHKDDPIIPMLTENNERFLALDEHPTAEVLSKMIYQHLKQAGFNVAQVVLWETASAHACYQEN